MADSKTPPEEPSTETPLLLGPVQTHEVEEEFTDAHLIRAFKKLQTFLRLMGFHQSSLLGISLSWIGFLLVGVLIPVLIIEIGSCSGCAKYQISTVEYIILVFQASLAAVSLLCISHIIRKHGLQKFLFVDREYVHRKRFKKQKYQKIQDFFRWLILCTFLCFFLKIIIEVFRDVYLYQYWWKSSVMVLASVISWTYLTTISLSACLLFNLVCNLQIIHFDDYGKLLESHSDVLAFLKEHICLRHHLSKISHRFRIYLLLEFLLVTASQLFTIFRTTDNRGIINLINGGNFAVISIAQVFGIVISLYAAAKFSHRAQSLASVASRWHALVTCRYSDPSESTISNSENNLEAAIPVESLPLNYYESDLESLTPVMFSNNAQMPSYHKRQALVTYLQCNLGGVTIFGWTIDRVLINTMFFVELSLISFVLGKTILLTT